MKDTIRFLLKNSTNNSNIIRRSFSYLILFYWSTYLHLWQGKTSLLFLICKVQIVMFVYLMRHSKESQIKRLTFTNTNSIQRKYLDIMCNFIAIMLAPKRIFTLYSLNWASSILGFSYLLGLLKKFFHIYIAVVFDAVIPEISDGEFLSDDDGGAKYHHEANSHNTTSRMIKRKRIIEH